MPHSQEYDMLVQPGFSRGGNGWSSPSWGCRSGALPSGAYVIVRVLQELTQDPQRPYVTKDRMHGIQVDPLVTTH
jgi:hypothetical protein